MHVDAVLILRIGVFEIAGKAKNGGEFMPGLGIEVGVSGAGVDRAVSYPNLCKTPLVGFATEETVESLETIADWPAVKGAGGCPLRSPWPGRTSSCWSGVTG